MPEPQMTTPRSTSPLATARPTAALERGDEDSRGALRLLARHGERVSESLEGLQQAALTEETR